MFNPINMTKNLFHGICVDNFNKMNNSERMKTLLKVTAIAVAAGILVSFSGNPIAAFATYNIVAITAFAYFTQDRPISYPTWEVKEGWKPKPGDNDIALTGWVPEEYR